MLTCRLTYSDEVLLRLRVDGDNWSIIEEQPVGRLSQKLQRDMTLETRHDGRKPGVALAAEGAFGLLALRPIQQRRTQTPETQEVAFSQK